MKVTLINATDDALDQLLFTKQTRLEPSPELLDEIRNWPMERKMEELDYMLGTIQSSWEFVDYTFLLQGVSRAFTHQFVRTRTGSYAMESQRAVDKTGFEYHLPEAFRDDESEVIVATQECAGVYENNRIDDLSKPGDVYDWTMGAIDQGYTRMVQLGAKLGDARGVLPTNVATNIVAKFNLRTLADMGKLRLCYRTQGEYQTVFREMRRLVIEKHPWTENFINVHCVAVGTCAFPHFKECPIKGGVFNPDSGKRWDESGSVIRISVRDPETEAVSDMEIPVWTPPNTRLEQKKLWEETSFEADPSRRKS